MNMEHSLTTLRASSHDLPVRPAARGNRPPRLGNSTPQPDTRTWLGLFGSPALSAAEQGMLVALARTRTVPPGANVFHRGDTASTLVLAHSGDVALGYRGADGVFRIERPVRGPAWLDQGSAWLHEHHAMDARATSEAVIVELPCEAVQSQLELHPGLVHRFVVSLAREVQNLSTNTHALMHKDAPARFAAWLGQRLEAAGDSQNRLQLGERKRDIASQLAITPETLSRLIRGLTRQGVISVVGYSVQVLDRAALLRVAAGA